MKTPKILPAALALAALLFANQPALACTGGALIAKDSGVAVGRTLEFGEPLNSVLAVWPAGSEFVGTTSTGDNGLKWKSKYGFVGPTAATHYDMLIDGINDQGLNVGLFYFPGYAQYAEATPENAAKGMAPAQVTAWILGNFANVAEVKANIGKIALLPVVLDLIGIVPDMHIKVQDPSGECIVIEPRGGKLEVYENPVRVLTNAPEFPWMLTNLNNYLNMSAAYPADKKNRRPHAIALRHGRRLARSARRLHASFALRAHGVLSAKRPAAGHQQRGRWYDVPFPQQLRHPARRRNAPGRHVGEIPRLHLVDGGQ
jgi:penicillin V acylase-like amidase (Ntn superfamily)